MNFHKLLRACKSRLVAEIRALLDRFLGKSHFIGFFIALPAA